MKVLEYLISAVLLACSSVQTAVADDGNELYRTVIGFVPDHVMISGWTVVDYRSANPRPLNFEAEGGVAAIRYLADLLGAFDRVEIDEKSLNGIAAGLAISIKLSKGKQSAEISLLGVDNLVINNPRPRRAFDLQPKQGGELLFEKLTDSLLLHIQGNQKTWSRVVLKKTYPRADQ